MMSTATPLADSRPAAPAEALVLDSVTKRFSAAGREVVALHDVSLQLTPGTITGLIGPDGAGKTTLMRLAAGLLWPDEGTVHVFGLDMRHHGHQVQASLGYMPQRFGLYEDLTVQENLDLYADLQGVPHAARTARYRELMQMTGLAPFTSRLAGRLSGGMKQKLGLACTLVHPPGLLLLDEPTVGVDPVSRRELWQIVDRFVREEGTTVLLSTAYLDEAERCDDLIILYEGRLLGQGKPDVFERPLEGRTFKVRLQREHHNRSLEQKLSTLPEVVDAVIQGDAVRIVLREPSAVEAIHRALDPLGVVDIEAVPPRFEDAFVSMLGTRGRQDADKPDHDNSSETATDGTQPPRSTADVDLRIPTTDDTRPVIEVRDVKRRFGDFYAVKGVTFDVARGEVFGLLGANGAGKTTTFRMLCGLLPASEGRLVVAGIDVRRTAAAARARIGYMSQKFSLYGTLSVAQNLRFFSGAYGLRGRRRAARIRWAMEQFQLTSVANSNSGALPLGYKQRLALACALMHEPEILFLDEPTSGVDPLARREFWHRINALAARGVTVLVTTHFMEEAEYCDRLAIMVEGEILALGTPSQIKERARTAERPEPTMEDAFITLIQSRREQPARSGEAKREA